MSPNTYFKHSQEIRQLIYITNTIEGFNRQLRKVTKAKSVFPADNSLLKMLYLALMGMKANRMPAGLENKPYAKGCLLCGKYACTTLMSKDI